MLPDAPIRVFEHGSSGPCVIVLHGGPGGAGEATPLAAMLGCDFRVLEPWQRGSGGEPLTVARHVEDLHEVVRACGQRRPAIVGHSWGAMLALSYASAHPDAAGPLVLVGCGTYDPIARARLNEIVAARVTPALEAEWECLETMIADETVRAVKQHELIDGVYAYELDETVSRPHVELDVQAQRETWDDVLRLQEEGMEPASFSAITAPVLMVHGDADPHPGEMIAQSIRRHIPQLEYVELERCGHDPWLERYARGRFFEVVREWLSRHEPDGV